MLTLRNRARRRLTTLHVAHLRADIKGEQTVLAGGTCEPGDFYGPPVLRPPISDAVGSGISGRGTVCPNDRRAAGLRGAAIMQIDDLGAGQTRTEVPDFQRTIPLDGATLYGDFLALATASLPGPHGAVVPVPASISLTISPAGSGGPVFHAGNVDTAAGVPVTGLSRGSYRAEWVLSDANGDTRTIDTQFVEAG